MRYTRALYFVALMLGLFAFLSPVSAQSLETNPPVEIKNNSNETRKICMHKPKRVTLFAIGCVELKKGEKIFWDRKGVFTPFKVKVYKVRKVIDKYLYSRDMPADTGKIIIGTGGRFGFSRFKNIRKQYTLRVCNNKYDPAVYFTLGFETNYGTWTEGWWNVKKGECKNIPVSKRLKENHNIPYGTFPRTFYYARTYNGAESLYWRGGEGDNSFCVNTAKKFLKLQFKQDGTGIRTPMPCEEENDKFIKFRRLKDPSIKKEMYNLTF